ncbi:MAG: two-component system response regulator [Thermodesulfobacteriota bacterium]
MFDISCSERTETKFLLIDDDPIFTYLFNEIVRLDFNAEVLTAKYEDEALNKAVSERPSLIVLNLFLSLHGIPVSLVEGVKRELFGDLSGDELGYSLGNGFRIAAMLKDREETRAIPILGLSTLDRDFVRAGVRSARCDGFITKPFAINDLVSNMENLMVKSQGMGWNRHGKEIWRKRQIER